MLSPYFIAVDWGSTNLRAFLVARDGSSLDQLSSPRGVRTMDPAQFKSVLDSLLAPWFLMYPKLLVLCMGMVGSTLGWQEVCYCPTPVNLEALILGAQTPVPGYVLIPGVAQDFYAASTCPDVMRGEEVQVMGAAHQLACDKAIFCLPGTHSKWVNFEDGQIKKFTTFYTGELYGLLRQHSIHAFHECCEPGLIDEQVFKLGLSDSLRQRGLLADLFSIRANELCHRVAGHKKGDYMSGLLIGHELLQARVYWQEGADKMIALVGAQAVVARYAMACGVFKIKHTAVDCASATVRGLWLIAEGLNQRRK